MGDRLPKAPATGIDMERLESAVEAAFANPADLTAALVVVHRGRLVAERYALGTGRDTQLESWSMGKSVTATLVGMLVQEGELRLDQPAPVAEWRHHGDPRGQITVAHLLRMSSGLRFSFPTIEGYEGTARPALATLLWSGVPDHVRIYTGMEDVFRFAIDAPAEHTPGRVGRYRNSDPLVLGAIVRRILEARDDDYLSWPQRALFDRIGVRRQVLETDVHGNFILTGYDYGTARGWARLGLLYLNDGIWQGERLLPEGFVEFVSTPAPAWSEPLYGGLFWLNRTGHRPGPVARRHLLDGRRRRAARDDRTVARPGGGAPRPRGRWRHRGRGPRPLARAGRGCRQGPIGGQLENDVPANAFAVE
jgi:CubicO group peptidase (beta-lactamase class C family)